MANLTQNSERRREQNRRAQANLRRKQQERVEELQRQVSTLKAQLQTRTEKLQQNQNMNYGNTDEMFQVFQYDNNTSFQAVFQDVSGLFPEENLLTVNLPAASLDTFFPNHQQLLTPCQSSRPPATSRLLGEIASTATSSQSAVSAVQQLYCGFDALARNAALLGITPESFLSTSSNSIFYSPLQSVASVQASIQQLPPEFHPTMAQLSYPHQPWIDCIPIKDLRSRIIFGVSHRPPFLDSLEVWHDVLADGLTCLADPKDARSWTMSNDFMQRWQMLLIIDLVTLETMCLTTNPPLRKISVPGC